MKAYNQHINNLISRYVQGEIDASQLRELNDFIEQNDENRQYVLSMREMVFYDECTKPHHNFDVEQALQRFHAHVRQVAKQKKQAQRQRIRRQAKVVAMVLVMFLPVVAYFAGWHNATKRFAMIATTAPNGSQVTTILPDGSEVKLNSGSTISYSHGFGISQREIHLQGEGFFNVRHNERLPMMVITKDVVLHDQGTAFKVSNYKEDRRVMVSLYEGRLSVDNLISQRKALALNPGQRMVVDKNTGKLQRENIKETKEEGASMNTLYFDNLPLEEIAPVLARSFDVLIDVAKSVRNKRFYLIFNKQISNIDQILQIMAQTGQIKYNMANGRYRLY